MAKKGPRGTIRLVSADGKAVYYTSKNSRNTTDKLKRRKYNRKTRKHEVFTEGKMPSPK
ncbi:MAG: 50S ribosomal protein L33 [Alphaproteobacteria bacterium]|jgi:large subunit ribosomal protein L33